MSFLDGARSFIDKFGFFGGDEDLGTDDEIDEAEEAENEDAGEDEDSSFLSRFGRIFSGRKEEREEPDSEQPAPNYTPRMQESANPSRDNIIRDERMTGRAAQNVRNQARRAHVVQVRQIEECRDIIKFLLDEETVLLNLENADPKDCGRIVDLLSGAAYALQGRMLKVAHLCYLLAPQDVEIVNDSLQRQSPHGKLS